MKRAYRFISFILVILIALSSFMTVKGFLEIVICRNFDSWLSDQPQIYTSQMSDETKDTFISVVRSYAQTHKMVLVNKKTESIASGTRILTAGVMSSTNVDVDNFLPFYVLNTEIINMQKIAKLLEGGPDAYFGYGTNSNDQIGELPSILGGTYFKLNQISSNYKLGNSCAVLGLSAGDFDELVTQISEATGLTKSQIIENNSGTSFEIGLFYYATAIAFVILSISFCLLTYFNSIQELKRLGVHVMLGWSKIDYVIHYYFSYFILAFFTIPLAFLWIMANYIGFDFDNKLVWIAFLNALPSIAVILLSVLISMVPLLTIRPVDAILGRLSQKGLYVLTTMVYVLCCAVVFAGSVYMDAPVKMYSNLLSTQKNWSEYKGWYVIHNLTIHGDFFSGRPMEKSKELYEWYKNHEHDDGVYIAHVDQVIKETLYAYGVDTTILEPFTELIASPSYLKEIGVNLSNEQIEKAENGTRIYLIPRAFSEEQKSQLREFIIKSNKIFDSNIVTPYMLNPQEEFIEYDGNRELFNWSTVVDTPTTSSNVVIKVVTANNMIPSESESLVASGLQNSYIKLSHEAASKLLNPDGVAELADDGFGTRFKSIESFIKDYRKSLTDLFLLFGVVIVLVFIAMITIQISLISIVQRLNERRISVECMLGFSIIKQYRNVFALVNIIALMGTLCMILVGSILGIIMGCLMFIISNATISVSAKRSTMKIVLENLSKE